MTKQERITAYRCAILGGRFADGRVFDAEYIENAAMAVLRAETDVARECDIGSCDKVAEPGDEFCKFHFERNR